MKNKHLILYLLLVLNWLNSTYANEVFNFDVTEIEILDNGNTIKGNERGKATSDGISVSADKFIYDKQKNVLYASGDVIIFDSIKKINIFSEDITYFKNTETIVTNSRSKATDKNTFIEGDYFKYKKKLNILNAKGNVEINNKIVLVATFSIHRKDSTKACEYIMDYLKKNAPIWKKEEYNNKTEWI